MRRRAFLFSLGTLGLTAALTGLSRGVQPGGRRTPRIITAGDSTYLLGISEPVLLRKVETVLPAPGGRYALVRQDLRPDPTDEVKEPLGEEKLWLYDAKTQRTALVLRAQDDPQLQVVRGTEPVAWFPNTKRALVTSITRTPKSPAAIAEARDGVVHDFQMQYGLFDIDRPTVRWLQLPPELAVANPLLNQPQRIVGLDFIIFQHDDVKQKRRYISFLNADGKFSPVFTVPYTKRPPYVRGLSEDGKQLYFIETDYARIDAGFVERSQWSALAIADGAITPLPEKPKRIIENNPYRTAGESQLPLQLSHGKGNLTGESDRKANVNALWLERRGPKPSGDKDNRYARALIAADANGRAPLLLSDNSAVLYTHEGTLYAMPLVSIDRVAFEKLQRELAMKSAKQMGLGLMMYAQDYDENFPPDGNKLKDTVLPYIMDENVISDFVYTYKGPTNLTKIENPASTQLGYIAVPGGQMAVFADGHVKFMPDKQ